MNKTDIEDAFKLCPIRVDPCQFHVVQWQGQYYFLTRLCFGSRSSPKLFTLLSKALHFIATQNYGIRVLLYLLDDFLSIDPPGDDSIRSMCLLTHIFKVLNIPLHSDKTLGPDTVMIFLGITLDSNLMQASLPRDKVDRIIEMLNQYTEKRSVSKRDLLSLLGHLNYASRIIISGRSFVSYLLSLAHIVKELYHHVKLNQECRSNINMWSNFLTHWNGISFFYDSTVTAAADIELYTDASVSYGYSGYYQGKWLSVPWPDDRPKLGDKNMSITFMELVPIVTAVYIWCNSWSGKRILVHSDNQSAVNIIQKGQSRSPMIMKLIRRLTLCCAQGNCTVSAVFIEGKSNLISDALSHSQMVKFRSLAPSADRMLTPVPPVQQLYFS